MGPRLDKKIIKIGWEKQNEAYFKDVNPTNPFTWMRFIKCVTKLTVHTDGRELQGGKVEEREGVSKLCPSSRHRSGQSHIVH